jgi:NitT/TauT family transport system substrate-binding protein
MKKARRNKLLGVALAAALLPLAACGGGSEGDEDLAEVDFILDWIPKGQTAPFFLAAEKGFWEKRGLKVNVSRGFGSGDTAVRVGKGQAEFGWAGVSAVMNTIAEGLPLQEVAITAHRAPGSLFSLDAELDGPESLKGLRGALEPNAEEASLMRAYAEQNGLDFDEDIDWEFTEGAGLQLAASGKTDVVADWGTNVPEWWQQDPSLDPNLLWVGVELGIYGNGIITQPDYLEDNADVAEAFVEGAVEAYQYVLEGGEEAQQEAIDALFKAEPTVAALPGAEEFHLANLQMFLSVMLDESVKEHGLGYMVPDRVDASLDFINNYLLDEPLAREDAFAMDPQLIDDQEFMIEDWDAAVESVSTVMDRPNPLLEAYPAN